MLTVLEIIGKTTEFFAARGIESPRLNAELIVGHALRRRRMQLYLEFERLLAEPEVAAIRDLVRRRGRREPLQYVTGEVEFGGLVLHADRRALIPRPETELLVETVAARLSGPPPARLLDLGTGTGAIALALARLFPDARITAVDESPDALALAGENAALCGLEGRVSFLRSDWLAALGSELPFDAIVSNPPYLSAEEAAAAEPEVRDFEPAGALVADDGGLADLRRILVAAPSHLRPGGLLALETGIGHHAALADLARESGYARTESIRDLTGRDRFLFAWMPEPRETSRG